MQTTFHSSKTYIKTPLTPSALSESAPSPAYLSVFPTDDIFLFPEKLQRSHKHGPHVIPKTATLLVANSDRHAGRSPCKISILPRKRIKHYPARISGHYPPWWLGPAPEYMVDC